MVKSFSMGQRNNIKQNETNRPSVCLCVIEPATCTFVDANKQKETYTKWIHFLFLLFCFRWLNSSSSSSASTSHFTCVRSPFKSFAVTWNDMIWFLLYLNQLSFAVIVDFVVIIRSRSCTSCVRHTHFRAGFFFCRSLVNFVQRKEKKNVTKYEYSLKLLEFFFRTSSWRIYSSFRYTSILLFSVNL